MKMAKIIFKFKFRLNFLITLAVCCLIFAINGENSDDQVNPSTSSSVPEKTLLDLVSLADLPQNTSGSVEEGQNGQQVDGKQEQGKVQQLEDQGRKASKISESDSGKKSKNGWLPKDEILVDFDPTWQGKMPLGRKVTSKPVTTTSKPNEADQLMELVEHIERESKKKNPHHRHRQRNHKLAHFRNKVAAMLHASNGFFGPYGPFDMDSLEVSEPIYQNSNGKTEPSDAERQLYGIPVPENKAPVNPTSNTQEGKSRAFIPIIENPSPALYYGVGIGIGACILVVLIGVAIVALIKKRLGRCSNLKEFSFWNLDEDRPMGKKVSSFHHGQKNNSHYIVSVLDDSRVSETDSMWSSEEEEELFDVANLKSNSPIVSMGSTLKSLTSTPVKK